MRVLGATCGVGSMLLGAREAGFSVLGNIEWRPYYHHEDTQGRNTFRENFPGSFFIKNIDQMKGEAFDNFNSMMTYQGIDLILGHPDCGNYSVLSNSLGNTKELSKNPGDIPIFVDIIRRLKPRFFAQDNLPKSLIGYPIEKWAEELPEYDLFPEWISNWGYGNVQKFRKRFFMIGALKTEKYTFTADEMDHSGTIRKTLFDIPLPDSNNEEHSLAGRTSIGKGVVSDTYMTWEQLREFVLNKLPEGKAMYYFKGPDKKQHIGTQKSYKEKHAFVLTGGSSFPLSAWTGLPFSIRERARIQGCPDDFQFYGTRLEPDGKWLCTKNNKVIKQIAKFMPIQFCTFLSKQIASHIKGEFAPAESMRILSENQYVNEAKKWFCEHNGYADQVAACKKCWLTCK